MRFGPAKARSSGMAPPKLLYTARSQATFIRCPRRAHIWVASWVEQSREERGTVLVMDRGSDALGKVVNGPATRDLSVVSVRKIA
jgi:hypothetical protein